MEPSNYFSFTGTLQGINLKVQPSRKGAVSYLPKWARNLVLWDIELKFENSLKPVQSIVFSTWIKLLYVIKEKCSGELLPHSWVQLLLIQQEDITTSETLRLDRESQRPEYRSGLSSKYTQFLPLRLCRQQRGITTGRWSLLFILSLESFLFPLHNLSLTSPCWFFWK